VSNRRLLLADDSLTIQKVVNLTFSDEGFDVQTVGDGDSALAAIRETAPDIVLADVNMPGADGYSICELLRGNETTRQIPVILLVGSFEPFDEEKAGQVGANAFLTKPFQSIRQLISQVNELLDATPSTNGHVESEQPEAEAATQPPPPNDDIESLYSQSFAADGLNDVEDDLERSMSGFDDSGLDDEMIETSYVSGNESSETLDFEIAGNNDAAESIREENAGLAPGIDQYFSEPEMAATDYETGPLDPFTAPAEPAGYTETYADDPLGVTQRYENFDETIPNANFGPSQPSEPTEPIADQVSDAESASYISEEPVSQMGIETVSFFPPASSRTYDEIDLLDIPPIGSSETVELTTAERAEIMGSDKQVMSISPELMEIIVQKVIEKMSQKY
jgi:CheY-like chemotaxis protein